MKIEKLLTLSLFVDLLNESSQEKLTAKLGKSKPAYNYAVLKMESYEMITKYNNFLKQPLKKEMFVNELDVVLRSDYGVDAPEFNTYKYPSECYAEDLKAFQEAEKKVIFEGFNYFKSQAEYQNTMQRGMGVFPFSDRLGVTIPEMRDGKNVICHHFQLKSLHNLAEATKGELKLKNVEL